MPPPTPPHPLLLHLLLHLQLDLICATVGFEQYSARLKWAGMGSFNASRKTAVYADAASQAAGDTGAFVRWVPLLICNCSFIY